MAEPAGVQRSDFQLRLLAGGIAVGLGVLAFAMRGMISPRIQGVIGIIAFISVVAAFSTNLRAISWRTVGWGMALQVTLALLILKFEITLCDGRPAFLSDLGASCYPVRPGFVFFSKVGEGVKQFLEFTNAGSRFVFGALADPATVERGFGPGNGFMFAFTALPTIIFVSSFFTVLYYFGVLQFIVRLFARVMQFAMRTSGAETLSAAANVFMGQTEAPIIVKPYVPAMTKSELLAMMVGGMATISGGVMAVYIALGADAIAILTTSVMAAPCGLYLSKLLLPEFEQPETSGQATVNVEKLHVNVIDAAAGGASDGMMLAVNVAAMLVAFLAFIAMVDFLLGSVWEGLTLARVFAVVFAPVAFLMGIPTADLGPMADLLGTKLVANEFVAFVKLTNEYKGVLSDRSYVLATYALTGFANIASIGIQLGGIGGMAPNRRGDLARLGGRALLAGFLATLINACVASMLI